MRSPSMRPAISISPSVSCSAIRRSICFWQGTRSCRGWGCPVWWNGCATDVWARLADYATENLTLATTRYLLDALKGTLKQQLAALVYATPRREAAD